MYQCLFYLDVESLIKFVVIFEKNKYKLHHHIIIIIHIIKKKHVSISTLN